MKRFLRSKLVLTLAALVMIAAAIVIPLSGSASSSQAAAGSVLILSTTVTNGTNSFEAQAAQALGLTVNIVDPATWDAMTTAQFNSYKAIILGDPECGSPGNSSPIDPATQNNTVWGPAITGNVVIIGTDPSYHANNGTSGALTMIKDGIKFATSIRGHTGAYISLSCYYYNTASNTPVPLLDAFSSGGFTVEGVSSENAHITYTPPAFYGLTDTDVSNWSNSIHEMFDKHPPYFRELANNEDNIHPYILVSAANTSSARGTQPPLIFPFNKPTSSHPCLRQQRGLSSNLRMSLRPAVSQYVITHLLRLALHAGISPSTVTS